MGKHNFSSATKFYYWFKANSRFSAKTDLIPVSEHKDSPGPMKSTVKDAALILRIIADKYSPIHIVVRDIDRVMDIDIDDTTTSSI